MGFDAGLYVYPRSDKDVTYNDLRILEALINYEQGDWAQKNFSSPEEYAKSVEMKYIPQPKERVDFYRSHLIMDEFGSEHIWKDYGYWCSNGAGDIYNYLSEKGDELNSYCGATRQLSKTDIADFMNFCLKKIIKHSPQPATIIHAYKYQRDENDEIPDDADITLFNVDGFEVEFEDENGNHSLKRIDTNPEWECCFGFPKEYMDDWEFNAYIIGLESCAKLLSEVDFENSIVIYNGGW